jgi:hypothetical protein
MSATMARQGDRVQLEQSNMRLALNMSKTAIEGFSLTAMEETQQLIKDPRAKSRKQKMQGVVFPGHNQVKAATDRHPAMVWENQMDGCHHCQNGTEKNSLTQWRR